MGTQNFGGLRMVSFELICIWDEIQSFSHAKPKQLGMNTERLACPTSSRMKWTLTKMTRSGLIDIWILYIIYVCLYFMIQYVHSIIYKYVLHDIYIYICYSILYLYIIHACLFCTCTCRERATQLISNLDFEFHFKYHWYINQWTPNINHYPPVN